MGFDLLSRSLTSTLCDDEDARCSVLILRVFEKVCFRLPRSYEWECFNSKEPSLSKQYLLYVMSFVSFCKISRCIDSGLSDAQRFFFGSKHIKIVDSINIYNIGVVVFLI